MLKKQEFQRQELEKQVFEVQIFGEKSSEPIVIPENAVIYNGVPLTYNGDFITYT